MKERPVPITCAIEPYHTNYFAAKKGNRQSLDNWTEKYLSSWKLDESKLAILPYRSLAKPISQPNILRSKYRRKMLLMCITYTLSPDSIPVKISRDWAPWLVVIQVSTSVMLDAVILERKHTATTITVAIFTPHATSGPLKPEHGNLRTKETWKTTLLILWTRWNWEILQIWCSRSLNKEFVDQHFRMYKSYKTEWMTGNLIKSV